MALTAAGLSPSVTPIMATMNWQTTIPRAPQMSRGRRPNLSIVQKEMGVEQTLTSVVTKLIKKGFLMVPRVWKKVVYMLNGRLADATNIRTQKTYSEVEHEIDTGPLLHHLEGGAEDGAAQVTAGIEYRSAEAVEP